MHPFVKWAGGKTQLMDKLIEHMPEKYNHYYEPFIGGGALLFHVKPNKFTINDFNSELIQAYLCFESYEKCEKLKLELIKHESSHSEEHYYEVRNMDRDISFTSLAPEVRAGRMIYLNKACFNGLYRVNAKGYFNVPSGKKKIVSCFDETNFKEITDFFLSTKHMILNGDFEESVKEAQEGDFVYFDPPYDTWDDKESFTSYAKNPFGKDEQKRLSDVCKSLSQRGVKFMVSNHNTNYIRELYKDFNIYVVPAKRMINSKASGRGDVEEVIITNYEK